LALIAVAERIKVVLISFALISFAPRVTILVQAGQVAAKFINA
jgi:hypothetical protein